MMHPTNHQIKHSHQLPKTLIPWQKPFISGIAPSPSLFCTKQFARWKFTKRKGIFLRRVSNAVEEISKTETSTRVKAVVGVKETIGGFFSNMGISHGLDDVADLLGKSLLLELVSAELDPETGLEKPTIKKYAHKVRKEKGEVKYECEFEISEDFGKIGAVLVENEHHTEMFVASIRLDGFANGPINVTCESWVHSKFKSSYKRVFFTNKIMSLAIGQVIISDVIYKHFNDSTWMKKQQWPVTPLLMA